MTMALHRWLTVPVATCLLTLSSCIREPLELYYDGRAELHLTYDWMSSFGERPDGMTLMVARNNDSISYYDASNQVDRSQMKLQSGYYLLTAMNRTFGEYGTMRFFRRESHNNIYAVANTYNITAETAWDHGRSYMEEPERIGVAVDTLLVYNTIDSLVFYDYRKRFKRDTVHIERQETILSMTTTLNIRVKVRGFSYMRSVEGYISGMADGFLLNQRWRRTEVGNLRLDHWQSSRTLPTRADDDPAASNVGWVTTSVETFGLPHGRELLRWRSPESNYLLLHFTLIDGRTVDFGYAVGKDVRYRGDDGTLDHFTQGDVELELDLEIDAPFYADAEVPLLPYAQPEGTGQFDAEVAPWGDDVDVEIPM